MSRESELTIGFALVIAMGCGVSNAAAQTDKYPRMAAIGQYLMEKNAEIQLARSAAPESISREAEVLILGRHGFETAVKGKNSFVCIVARSWTSVPDPDFWNPKVRVPMCLNAPAARSYLLHLTKETEWGLAGRTQAQMTESITAAIAKKNCQRWNPGRCATCCRSKGTPATAPPTGLPT
jgi:hypothetical protein